MAKILTIGSISSEKQYVVDNIAGPNEVAYVRTARSLTSSKVINAGRVLLKRHSVSILSCVGNDSDGQVALTDLKKYGFKTDLVQQSKKHRTGEVLTIIDQMGQPSFTLYFGATEDIQIPNNLPNVLKPFDFIYLETSLIPETLYTFIDMARSVNVSVLMDPPNRQQEIDKTKLQSIEFLIPNKQEAGLFLGRKIETVQEGLEAAEQMKQFCDGSVIITLDKDGCVVFEKNGKKPYHLPTEPVNVKDSTAAGDIFRAVLLDNYLRSRNIKHSVQVGLEFATESVAFEGVDQSIKAVTA